MISDHTNEHCEKFELLLENYVNGELSRSDAERVATHLDACGNCRAALDDARISARLVSAFEAVPDPGPGFARMVMARINVAERWIKEQRSFWRPFEALVWRLAFSAVLALAFLFAYGIRVSHQTSINTATTVSAQQPDIFTVPVSTAPSSGDDVLVAIAEHRREP
jgi:anti-sigma factor RsiW